MVAVWFYLLHDLLYIRITDALAGLTSPKYFDTFIRLLKERFNMIHNEIQQLGIALFRIIT